MKYLLLLVFVTLIVAWACTPMPAEHKAAKGFMESLSRNDISVAKTMANNLNNKSSDLSRIAISDLCAIAVSLMKLSQADEEVNDYAAQALKYYEAAIMKDSVATDNYLDMLGPEDYNSIHLLRQLRSQIQAREAGAIYAYEENEQ